MIHPHLFPREKAMTGPGDKLRPFFIYSNGAPAYSVDFCYCWEFLVFLYAVRIAQQNDVVINPFFGIWN
jgi:hypothetical protein